MERMRAIKAQSQKRLWERGSMQREEIIRVIENSVKQFISLRENLQEIMNSPPPKKSSNSYCVQALAYSS